MKEKMKKYKRKIILQISSIMLAVFIVVSLVFSSITLGVEKQTQITKSHNDVDYMVDAIKEMYTPPYNEACKYLDIVKSHLRDIQRKEMNFDITCGADGTYDKNIHIAMYEYTVESPESSKINLIMDTDKEIYFSFMVDDYSEYYFDSGLLNYDEFVSSISKNDLATIREYLNIEKDEDGYFYLLVCKDGYYNGENGHIYPKTVEIVKAYEDSNGYGVAQTVETFELNPKNTKGLTLCQSGANEPCVIDGQFVCNDIYDEDHQNIQLDSVEYTDPDTGLVEKDGLFSYRLSEVKSFLIQSLRFEGSKDELDFYATINGNDDDYEVPYRNIVVLYSKHINLLECCSSTLIIGNSIIFLFFFIIAMILIIMMCKVMKTQINEEEKRSELTNALAHDIKTPLFIISGYAQNLKENVNTDKRDHYCDKIIDKTQDVNELVHKMLELSRFDGFEKVILRESINLSQLTQEITESYDRLPDEKSFVINTSKDCVINADKDLIHRAVTNLISNAVTYSDSKSEIRIDISNTAFSVSNKCSCISQSDIKHLTEPYYRVDKNRNTKGNGLGLSIVKSIAEMHSYKLNIKLNDSMITFTLDFH